MSGLARWWAEARDPKLKCRRVGPEPHTEWREGWVNPEWTWSHVADRVRQERTVCKRCGDQMSPWITTKRTGLNGLTAGSNVFDDIENGGHWFARGFEKQASQ